MGDLDWMYEVNPDDEAAEAENTADEKEAQFDVRLDELLYGDEA